jgi:hypothetical protein
MIARRNTNDHLLIALGGGKTINEQIQLIGVRIVPHARTLRKAREQVKIMVATGFSTRRIRSYLKKWALWWAITSETWNDEYLLQQFFKSCWDFRLGEFAADLLANTTSSRTSAVGDLAVAA